MRIDALRLFDILKAYEKSDLQRNRPRGGDGDSFLAVRDEVILSTEATRRHVFERIRDQVVERLRTLPPSQGLDQEVETILEGATLDVGGTPLGVNEKARTRKVHVDRLRRERTSE